MPSLPTLGGICHSAQHLAFILISHFNQSIKAAQQLVNHSKSAKCQSVGGRGEGGGRGAALGLTFNPTLNNHTHIDRGSQLRKDMALANSDVSDSFFALRRAISAASAAVGSRMALSAME